MAAPERPTGSSPAVPRTLLLGAALIAATTLMLELLLTRVFDVVLLPNTAYMVITCAVFAYGLAGLYVTVRPFREQLSVDRVAAVLTLLVAGTSVLLLPAMNIIPFKGQSRSGWRSPGRWCFHSGFSLGCRFPWESDSRIGSLRGLWPGGGP